MEKKKEQLGSRGQHDKKDGVEREKREGNKKDVDYLDTGVGNKIIMAGLGLTFFLFTLNHSPKNLVTPVKNYPLSHIVRGNFEILRSIRLISK